MPSIITSVDMFTKTHEETKDLKGGGGLGGAQIKALYQIL